MILLQLLLYFACNFFFSCVIQALFPHFPLLATGVVTYDDVCLITVLYRPFPAAILALISKVITLLLAFDVPRRF